VLQKTWTYQLLETDYIVELHVFMQSKLNGSEGFVRSENRWNVEVFHPDWEKNLSPNAHLHVGSASSWREREYEWFPPFESGDGEGRLPGEVWESGRGTMEQL
jgi:hypothetical protein